MTGSGRQQGSATPALRSDGDPAESADPVRWWTKAAVRDYRRRRHAGPLAFLAVGCLPPFAAVLLICRALAADGDPLFGMLLPLLLLLGSMLVGLPLGAAASLVATAIAMRGFRCPRCGERYAPLLFEGPRCQRCGFAGPGARG